MKLTSLFGRKGKHICPGIIIFLEAFIFLTTIFVQFWFDIWTEWEWKDHPFTGAH
jgi:hypothetical protein